MDWCGKNDTVEGHKNLSAAMNATGRPMVLELCRGDYQNMPDWGYAPDIAQVGTRVLPYTSKESAQSSNLLLPTTVDVKIP